MTKWVALLRGVNVGGHNKLPMAGLRTMLEGLGYEDPKTYIQSGNAVFSSGEAVADISNSIRSGILLKFGFQPRVMVLDLASFNAAIRANPYPQASETPNFLHLFFFEKQPNDIDSSALSAWAKNGEEFALLNGVFYFFTPNGFGRSDLAAKLTSIIKEPMTGRNLHSCLKISELAGVQ